MEDMTLQPNGRVRIVVPPFVIYRSGSMIGECTSLGVALDIIIAHQNLRYDEPARVITLNRDLLSSEIWTVGCAHENHIDEYLVMKVRD